jgi:hypothetical protein
LIKLPRPTTLRSDLFGYAHFRGSLGGRKVLRADHCEDSLLWVCPLSFRRIAFSLVRLYSKGVFCKSVELSNWNRLYCRGNEERCVNWRLRRRSRRLRGEIRSVMSILLSDDIFQSGRVLKLLTGTGSGTSDMPPSPTQYRGGGERVGDFKQAILPHTQPGNGAMSPSDHRIHDELLGL